MPFAGPRPRKKIISTPRGSLWGLVDCNNFFASCEQIFRPDLRGKPVVVLSSNDGCIVARSAEAKALGIKMGQPEFQIRDFLARNKVAVFSSNFELYSDISRRVMDIMEEICPDAVEQYSIDEAFINLNGALKANVAEVAAELRASILKRVGITVSVGIATTRTLAKVANHIAKKQTESGICLLLDSRTQAGALQNFPIEEVWGIGRRSAAKLRQCGLKTAWDLCQRSDEWIRKLLTVSGLNTTIELRGQPAVGEGEGPVPRKSLAYSRTFGNKVTDRQLLGEAVASYIARAAEKLRQEGLHTRGIEVRIRTARFGADRFYENAGQVEFDQATSDTAQLQQAGRKILEAIYREGYKYAKAGVLFFDLTEKAREQGSLLARISPEQARKREALMAAIDKINARHKCTEQNRAIKFAGEGKDNECWAVRKEKISPRYTTSWEELAKALAK